MVKSKDSFYPQATWHSERFKPRCDATERAEPTPLRVVKMLFVLPDPDDRANVIAYRGWLE